MNPYGLMGPRVPGPTMGGPIRGFGLNGGHGVGPPRLDYMCFPRPGLQQPGNLCGREPGLGLQQLPGSFTGQLGLQQPGGPHNIVSGFGLQQPVGPYLGELGLQLPGGSYGRETGLGQHQPWGPNTTESGMGQQQLWGPKSRESGLGLKQLRGPHIRDLGIGPPQHAGLCSGEHGLGTQQPKGPYIGERVLQQADGLCDREPGFIPQKIGGSNSRGLGLQQAMVTKTTELVPGLQQGWTFSSSRNKTTGHKPGGAVRDLDHVAMVRNGAPLRMGHSMSPSTVRMGESRSGSPVRMGYIRSRSPVGMGRNRGPSPVGMGCSRGHSPVRSGRSRGHSPVRMGHINDVSGLEDGRSTYHRHLSSILNNPIRRQSPSLSKSTSQLTTDEKCRTEQHLILLQQHSLKIQHLPVNLSDNTHERTLRYMFGKYGELISVCVHNSGNECCAIVSYRHMRDRDNAIAGTKGVCLLGMEIMVTTIDHNEQSRHLSSILNSPIRRQSPSLSKSTSQLTTDEKCRTEQHLILLQQHSLKVQHLPVNLSDYTLKRTLRYMFGKYGELISVSVHNSGNECCAIVSYRHMSDRDNAIAGTKGVCLLGMEIKVTTFDNNEQSHKNDMGTNGLFSTEPSMTLYIGNLDKTITPVNLARIFKCFGEVLQIDIKIGSDNRPNFAFVQFGDIASVRKAFSEMKGKLLGKNKPKLKIWKNPPSNCVWLYGFRNTDFTEETLTLHFRTFGPLVKVLHDVLKGTALLLYKNVFSSVKAIRSLSKKVAGHMFEGTYANHMWRRAFCRSMESSGQDIGNFLQLLEKTDEKPSVLTIASEERQILAEVSVEEAQMLAEGSAEEAQMLAEASEEETQMLAEASEAETQVSAEASEEEAQMLAEVSTEEAQVSAEASEEAAQMIAEVSAEEAQMLEEASEEEIQMTAEASEEETQMTAEASEEETQMSAELRVENAVLADVSVQIPVLEANEETLILEDQSEEAAEPLELVHTDTKPLKSSKKRRRPWRIRRR